MAVRRGPEGLNPALTIPSINRLLPYELALYFVSEGV
jgi:hypothetical protein